MANQFTNAGLNRILNYGLTAAGIPYLAVGTGTATFSAGLAAMGVETLRLAIHDNTGVGAMANQRMALGNSQAVATLTEMAAFDDPAAGNLLSYKTFFKSLVKTDDDTALLNHIAAIVSPSTNDCLTYAGRAALRAGGVTITSFPYIAICSDALLASQEEFLPNITDAGAELARGATAVNVVGAIATITRTFGAGVGTGTIRSVRLYDAASGGNLLGYLQLATAVGKTAGQSRDVSIPLTIANKV